MSTLVIALQSELINVINVIVLLLEATTALA